MATKAVKNEKNMVAKELPKKGSAKKAQKKAIKKDNFFKKVIKCIAKHKIIFSIVSAIILIIIFTLLFLKLSLQFTVLTIGDDKYSKADMNMSLYNLKYNYFGKDASEIPDATLDEQLTSLNMTVSEYLKSEAVNELKYRSVIKKLANDNNITLSDEDKEEVQDSIKSVKDSFGSYGKFSKFLRKNGLTKKAYQEYLETNKLYDKVFANLYAKGKSNYLTDEEISKETSNYNNEYYKVNQIVLAIVDNSTLQSLNDTIINQKQALIEAISKEVKEGADFVELVKKYSEEANGDIDLYFTKDDVLEEIYNVVDGLEINEVSDVVKTKYAYSIIKRLPLDDKKLDDYLETKAKEKFNNDITKLSEDYKVFYENAYKKIK